MPSIPISYEVQVIPGVVGAGGNPLALNAVFLTTTNPTNPLVPAGSLLSFVSAADVGAYFGLTSPEYIAATIYFGGVTNGTIIPGTMLFSEYATAARPAWLRGQQITAGSFASQLAYLQSLTGTLIITIGSTTYTAASFSLSAATSIGGVESTSVINKIATALGLSTNGAVLWDSILSEFIITGTATGATQTISYCSGTLAASLGLTAGILSTGTGVDTPAGIMTAIAALSNNWVVAVPLFEPSNSDALGFAAWIQAQNDRYWFVLPDSDAGVLTANNTATIGAIIQAAAYDGVIVAWSATNPQYLAAFFAAYAASINWFTLNGRSTLKFRQQPGLSTNVPPITSTAQAAAILSNNSSYYGAYSAPGVGNNYNIVADGGMAGSRFLWADTYLGQLFLNTQLALAIFNGLTQVTMAPFGPIGDNFIRAWTSDPIQQAIKAGIIRLGIVPSSAQNQAITSVVGKDVSNALTTAGYYLYLQVATSQQRAQRISPPLYLYYMDGGAIQKVYLNSIVVI